MSCWSEYDKGFPTTTRTPCNGKGTLSKKSLIFVLPQNREAFNQENDSVWRKGTFTKISIPFCQVSGLLFTERTLWSEKGQSLIVVLSH